MTDMVMPDEYMVLDDYDARDILGGQSEADILAYVGIGLSVVATCVQVGGMIYAARANPQPQQQPVNNPQNIRRAGSFNGNPDPIERVSEYGPRPRIDVDSDRVTIVDNNFDDIMKTSFRTI